MKKVFVTLFITLILTIAYFGMAEAQQKPVAPSQPTITGNSSIERMKNRSAGMRVKSQTPVAAKPEAKPEAKKEEVKEVKEEADKSVVFEGSASTTENKEIKYSIKEKEDGKFVITAKDAGCSSCKESTAELSKARKDLNKNDGEIPQLKELALAALKTKFGEVKDSTKVSAADKRKQDKIDTCKLDSDGKYFKDSDAQADCIKEKLSELIATRDPKNDSKISALKALLLENYTKDLSEGKTRTNSPFIELVMESISNPENRDQKMISLMLNIQAEGHLAAVTKMQENIQTQFQLAQSNINSGNHAAAKAISDQLTTTQKTYKALTTSAIGAIQRTSGFSNQEASLRSSMTSFDVTLVKLNTNIVASQNKSGNSGKVASKNALDFSLDNSAADSAGGNSGRVLNTESDFDRIYQHSIRGLDNNDFKGTSPSLRPDALMGTGQTALNQQTAIQLQNNTSNINNNGVRFQGNTSFRAANRGN